jgi:hypothetical protein
MGRKIKIGPVLTLAEEVTTEFNAGCWTGTQRAVNKER